MNAFVYLIKISGFLGNPETHIAKYYLGSCLNLKQRMAQHRSGHGAAILRACNERGIGYRIIKIHVCPDEATARELELKLKAYKNHQTILDADWNDIMRKPTVKTIRKQIQAIGGSVEFLSKVRDAMKESDPAIASELDDIILWRKLH